ncbi:hypothetical protein CUJ89_15550 [Burkholderia pyrrocinia]|uniref:Uncharacterized protein n=1 Tax=Burkholderia pyrrocinia TaxID=60550 RepID=A0A2Z5MWM6_BURPY|nr:hypothetical protein CUJ89_15550 [Burkholderia pyrrocinia]
MEIRSMFQPIVTRSLQYTHDRDRVCLHLERTCECPKSPVWQEATSAVWRAKQATSDAAIRAISGIPVT